MATVTRPCPRCEIPVTFDVPPEMHPDVARFCDRCHKLNQIDKGDRFAYGVQIEGALFPLGEIRIEAAASEALADAREHSGGFLQRHVRGDWGVADDTARTNKAAMLSRRGFIVSKYRTAKGVPLMVATVLESTRDPFTMVFPSDD